MMVVPVPWMFPVGGAPPLLKLLTRTSPAAILPPLGKPSGTKATPYGLRSPLAGIVEELIAFGRNFSSAWAGTARADQRARPARRVNVVRMIDSCFLFMLLPLLWLAACSRRSCDRAYPAGGSWLPGAEENSGTAKKPQGFDKTARRLPELPMLLHFCKRSGIAAGASEMKGWHHVTSRWGRWRCPSTLTAASAVPSREPQSPARRGCRQRTAGRRRKPQRRAAPERDREQTRFGARGSVAARGAPRVLGTSWRTCTR